MLKNVWIGLAFLILQGSTPTTAGANTVAANVEIVENDAVSMYTVGTFEDAPYFVAVTPDKNILFTSYSEKLYHIDIVTKLIRQIALPEKPGLEKIMLIQSMGGWNFVGSSAWGSIFRFSLDTDSLAVTAKSWIDLPRMLPFGLQSTKSGDLYVGFVGNLPIKIPSIGRPSTPIQNSELLIGNQGIFVSEKDEIYIPETQTFEIIKYRPGITPSVLKLPNKLQPRQMVGDSEGNIYVTSTELGDKNGYLLKIAPSGSLFYAAKTKALLDSIPPSPTYHLEGIALVGHDLYFVNQNQNAIVKIDLTKEEFILLGTDGFRDDPLALEKKGKNFATEDSKLNNSLAYDKQKYNFDIENGKLNNWEGSSFFGNNTYTYGVGSGNYSAEKPNQTDNTVVIKTEGLNTILRPAYFGEGHAYYSINTNHDKELAGKKIIFKAQIQALEPGCVRVGFYRGNNYQEGRSPYNRLGERQTEELSYSGMVDLPFTSSIPEIYIEPYCVVTITDPILIVQKSDDP